MTATKRKIIQLVVDPEPGDLPTLYALADDGTIWMNHLCRTTTRWTQVCTEEVEIG